MHDKATTRTCKQFPIFHGKTKGRNRRESLPDDAEENIPRLPYWIAGYDIDARVSEWQRAFLLSAQRWYLGMESVPTLGFETCRV